MLLCQASKISSDAASQLLQLLQRVVNTHTDTAIKQTAMDIRVLLATHGRVSVSSFDSLTAETESSTQATATSCVKDAEDNCDDKLKLKALIEVISSSSSEDPMMEQSSSQSSIFQTAITEVSDVLVPVRGHALLTLRRLIDDGDPDALNAVDKLLLICEKTVDDPDSYVYLNTVSLLASLAARFPQQTLPWLADKYLAVGPSQASDVACQQNIAERRMKLGEVLVKTSSALGIHGASVSCVKIFHVFFILIITRLLSPKAVLLFTLQRICVFLSSVNDKIVSVDLLEFPPHV